MLTKERLYELIDELPESAWMDAERVLTELRASEDDEPLTDDERAALDEAWEDVRNGRLSSLQEVKREFGIPDA
jgi:hypothetical protein